MLIVGVATGQEIVGVKKATFNTAANQSISVLFYNQTCSD